MKKSPLRYGIPVAEEPRLLPSVDRLLADAHRAFQNGRLEEAVELSTRVLQRNPKSCLALQILGVARFKLGSIDESIECFEKAVLAEPNNGEPLNNLGNALAEIGRYDDAVTSLERAVQLSPGLADAHNNLARIYGEVGRIDEALAAVQKAVELNPGLAEAYINFGKLLMDVGLTDHALTVFSKAVEAHPRRADAHSNYLMCLQYSSSHSEGELFEEARRWARTHAPESLAMPAVKPSAVGRRLRVGYVSGDFRAHPVGYVVDELFAGHDRSKYEVFAYSNVAAPDEITQGLRGSVDHWRDIWSMTDEDAAKLVRADGVDVLVDLAGHTALNRLGVFARRPAPVQATWLGYFATTGMPQMDYILRGRNQIPETEEPRYVEKVAVLPGSLFCFAPPREETRVGPPPALSNGFVTFGCFNNLSKLNGPTVALWSRVLNAVPGSRMRLDRRAFEGEIAKEVLRDAFAGHGVDASRLIFAASKGRKAYFDAYSEVDVVLDTFPFNGATTTYESLWMGVPVVSLEVPRMVGHFGASILGGVGRSQWVAQDEARFAKTAVDLVSDLKGLAETRASLRKEFLESPVCGGSSFVGAFEDALQGMWEKVNG